MKSERLVAGSVRGRLTLIERRAVPGPPKWVCKCTCGVIACVRAQELYKGDTRSCGCLRSETSKAKRIPWTPERFVRVLKANAKTRSLDWQLTDDEAANLITSDCKYCGTPPMQSWHAGGQITKNGIDRVDNALGYLPSNCVPCCPPCNMAKNALTKERFLLLVKRIYEHSGLSDG